MKMRKIRARTYKAVGCNSQSSYGAVQLVLTEGCLLESSLLDVSNPFGLLAAERSSPKGFRSLMTLLLHPLYGGASYAL